MSIVTRYIIDVLPLSQYNTLMKNLKHTIQWGIYVTLLLPLIFTSRTMYPWHFGKTVLFQIAIDILIFLGALYLYKTKEKIIRLHALDWAVLAFFGAQLIATIFGVDPVRSFWGYQSRGQGVVVWMHLVLFYFLLRQFFVEKKDWQRLLVWIVGVGVVSGIIAWIAPHVDYFAGKTAVSGDRLNGVIGNPLFFAAYMIFPTTFAFVLFARAQKDNRWRWAYLGAGVFCLVTTFFSQIRGVFLGIVAGAFFAVGLLFLFQASKKQKKRTGIVIALFVLVVGGMYVLFQTNPAAGDTLPVAKRLFSIRLDTATATTRFMAWDIALRGWQDHPAVGWGPENFQYAFDRYYNPAFLRYSFAETVWDKPHNFFLEVLSTMGILGVAAYLVLLSILFAKLKRLMKDSTHSADRIGYIVLTGGLVAYIVQSLFGIETTNSLQLWFVSLALVGWACARKEEGRTAPFKQVWWQAILVVTFLFAGFFAYKNTTIYRGSVLMSDARDAANVGAIELWKEKARATLDYPVPFLIEQATFTIQDISSLEGRGFLDADVLQTVSGRLVDVLLAAAQQHPDIYQHHFWLSEIYAFMGEYIDPTYVDRAIEELYIAGKLSPGQQRVPLTLSKNYLLEGRVKEAITILEDLVEQDSILTEPRWFLGLALIEDGQEDRGLQELEASLPFGTQFRGNILYLIDIYANREEYDKIVPLYEKLIEREPNNASFYASLAATYAALGDTEGLVESLNTAVALDPSLREEALLFLQQYGVDVTVVQ